MATRVEGPIEGTGELVGMRVWKGHPQPLKDGAGVLLEDWDRYRDRVREKYDLKSEKRIILARPWRWSEIPALRQKIRSVEKEIADLRNTLPV